MFIPGACHVSPSFVMFVRILQGLVEVSASTLHDYVLLCKKTQESNLRSSSILLHIPLSLGTTNTGGNQKSVDFLPNSLAPAFHSTVID